MTPSTVSEWALPWGEGDTESPPEAHAFALAWSLEEPDRIGEIARFDAPSVLGRGGERTEGVLEFFRERPSGRGEGRPLMDARISRRQLEVRHEADGGVRVTNVGKCPLLLNGRRATEGTVQAGDTLSLQNSVVLLVVRRRALRGLRHYPARLAFPFGEPDAHGIVGETPVIWELRDALAFAASAAHHVLFDGPSGAGKELAARAVHGLGARSRGPFVARSAATLPEALLDAELFGNMKNYPNPGMAERRGLVGEANGGTLFLDEIGELPASHQAHLLRVLDRGGEYQRLGESGPKTADFRLVAATNRQPSFLKPDFLARFASRITLPALGSRREDIPLLARHLLRRAAERTPALARFFQPAASGDEPTSARIDPVLLELLLRHRYTYELRELDRLLWIAASSSTGEYIAATPEVRAELLGDVSGRLSNSGERSLPSPADAPRLELGRADVERALTDASGSVTRAARALGLKNRFVLYRLMKRLGLEVE